MAARVVTTIRNKRTFFSLESLMNLFLLFRLFVYLICEKVTFFKLFCKKYGQQEGYAILKENISQITLISYHSNVICT